MMLYIRLPILILIGIVISGCVAQDNLRADKSISPHNGILVTRAALYGSSIFPVSLYYKKPSDSVMAMLSNRIAVESPEGSKETLIVREVPTGTYSFQTLEAGGSAFQLNFMSAENRFEIKPNTITYVGDFLISSTNKILISEGGISSSDNTQTVKSQLQTEYPLLLKSNKFETKPLTLKF